MKHIFLILVVFAVLASCKKNNISADNGCISQRQTQSFRLDPADSLAALQLLQNNHIATNDLEMEYCSKGQYKSIFYISCLLQADELFLQVHSLYLRSRKIHF